ncbi:MAG TPA: class I SAM-dependent methyltransferase, partial [Terrimicrobiaceae bacterium]
MNADDSHPTLRFSNTVEHYVRHRPDYPKQIVELLENECSLPAGSVIADIGSGTGIFSKLLLDNAYTVFGVEPNREMRQEAERWLADYLNFRSVSAAAESTGLQERSIDGITVATAFHWFDHEKAKIEFRRILKPKA